MRCLVLFSGSLESLLAARLMQMQGIEPAGVFFATLCARNQLPQIQADQLGMNWVATDQDEGYCEAIRYPTLGRTKNAAACLDCRVHLLRRARDLMSAMDASFLVTGEVVGQRPRSQNRRDLEAVAYHAEVDDLVVRPLSAKLLPVTKPERAGWIDREQLYAFHGSARQGLIQLAQDLGLQNLPASRPDCGLADPARSARVFDHLQHSAENDSGLFELLKIGRHFRFDALTKVIVGRNQAENERLADYYRENPQTAVLARPGNFSGPTALLLGTTSAESEMFAAALVQRFGKPAQETAVVQLQTAGRSSEMVVAENRRAASAVALGVP